MSGSVSNIKTDILQNSFPNDSFPTLHSKHYKQDHTCDMETDFSHQKKFIASHDLDSTFHCKDVGGDSCDPNNSKTLHKKANKSIRDQDFKELFHSIPQIRSHFQVLQKIGSGTFSNVYLATLRCLGKGSPLFALKHIFSTSHPKRIEREIKCLNEIGGKQNVIGMEGCIRHNGEVVIFMPYQKHTEFSEILGKMRLDDIREYMRQLLVALNHVHKNKVIHRDVKPNNFLFDLETHKSSLVDFGLAQFILVPGADSPMPGLRSKLKSTAACGNVHPLRSTRQEKENVGHASVETPTGVDAAVKRSPRFMSIADNSAPRAKRKCLGEIQTNNIRTRSIGSSAVFAEKPKFDFTPSKTPRFAQSCNIENIAAAAKPAVRGVRNQLKTMTLASPQRTINGCKKSSGTTIADVFPSIRKYGMTKEGSKLSRQSSLGSKSCSCFGKLSICHKCLARPTANASRAGTAGFRPPEVLLRCPSQTTAVDVWAAGVIFLTLLSGRCPFFRPADDVDSLAQLMLVFGSKKIQDVAKLLGKKVTCSQTFVGYDLRGIVVALRRSVQTKGRTLRSSPKSRSKSVHLDAPLYEDNQFGFSVVDIPDSAFDLLARFLDPNPRTRITALQALYHDFLITEEKKIFPSPTRSH